MKKRAPPPPPPVRGSMSVDRKVGNARVRIPIKAGDEIISHDSVQARKVSVRAMMVYVKNPASSLRHVYDSVLATEDPDGPLIKDTMAYGTFLKIAREEEWALRRETFWEEVRTRVVSKAQDSVVQKELLEIDDLGTIRAKLLEKIEAGPRVGSLEGVVNAYTRLDDYLSRKRRAVMEVVGRSIAEDNPAAPVAGYLAPPEDDEITEQEADEIAAIITAMRAGEDPTEWMVKSDE